MSSLHKHLPPRLLPAQLGGEGAEYQPAAWASSVLDLSNKTYSSKSECVPDHSKLLNSTAVKTPEIKKSNATVSKKTEIEEDEDDDSADERKPNEKPQSKGFTFEGLIRSGSRKFQLAQMTEDSEGFTLKKIKASSLDFSSNSLKSNDSSIFNFSKSKSLSVSSEPNDNIDDDNVEEDTESVYNFPKPKTSTSFTNSFTNTISNNMSKMGFNIRTKDGESSYNKGQPSSHSLLSSDAAAAT